MKYIRIVILAMALLCYSLKNVLHFSPWAVNIVNDILAVPVFLMVMEFLMQKIYGQAFHLSFAYVFFTVVAVSVLCEGIFPLLYKNTTADASDVLWYTVGGIGYYGLKGIRKNAESSTR